MRVFLRLAGLALFSISAYLFWADRTWEPAGYETGVLEVCRRLPTEPTRPFQCVAKLPDGSQTNAFEMVFENDDITLKNLNGGKVKLKVDVNKLPRPSKRYTFVDLE